MLMMNTFSGCFNEIIIVFCFELGIDKLKIDLDEQF